MRCPSCGARNADTADWCSQCYARFGVDEEAPAPAAAATTAPDEQASPSAPAPTPTAPTTVTGATATAGRLIRRAEDGVEWRCVTCEAWNPIERSTCSVCGSALADAFDREGGAPPPDVSATMVAAASVLLPGAGHLLLGRAAAGLGRMLLYVVWAIGGVALLRAAAGTDGSALPALPLLAGAFVLLATSVLDALALQRGSAAETLSVRSLLWLTVGVIGLTTLAFLGSALSVVG